MKLTICLLFVCGLLIYVLFLRRTSKLGEVKYTGSDPLDKAGKLPEGKDVFQSTFSGILSDEFKGIFNGLYPRPNSNPACKECN